MIDADLYNELLSASGVNLNQSLIDVLTIELSELALGRGRVSGWRGQQVRVSGMRLTDRQAASGERGEW